MSQSDAPPPGPDLRQGVPLSMVPASGVLAGHVNGAPVLLARLDDGIHAIGGACTHYGAPLAEGLVVGEEIRCPWHHACFSLRTGLALHAPAFAGLPMWRVEVTGDTVFVRDEQSPESAPPAANSGHPASIVIIGGGAAGYAAALRLRELGFEGTLTMLSADEAGPYDRPNLSKDYLAGTAPAEWIPLQAPDFYESQRIDLRLDCEVASIDTGARQVVTSSGERIAYDALLLATGAEPRRLPLPGFDRPNVFVLRSLADSTAIVTACEGARSVALVGGGFIGMEAAAALRARGLDVHVVDLDEVPMSRALGREVGGFIAGLHREQGVTFHLGVAPKGYDGKQLELADGTRVPADLLIVGAGVTPRVELATAAGLDVDNGILVDDTLQTSAPSVFAAGDVARYRYRGELIRVEHWVHAERQGQAAAANMLGAARAFADVPYFWTHHYGLDVRSTGHTTGFDEVRIDGDLQARDFTARYFRAGQLIAAVSAGRDLENLVIEAELKAG
ncbi:FAD-dependent oxidoreductase [Lysobacter niastensis]|uniref:FAD-dependent oxidoreductase n=1 Tax=Lysobacter niastensis TaxID=380629 RepID=A0ABS0B9S8_9GAMM|nr:FAD-dependent oxidoreductase [Lysobacter niastensis]MBF6024426.1 FAD-dependent oxidoreductase [Lysobacter niastensis]